MANKRKTKQEKKIADLRRKLHAEVQQTIPVGAPTYSLSTKHIASSPAVSNTKPVAISKYIISDLRKTFILSVIAIAIQIILYFFVVK